jgi:hypothetical protein
MTHLRLPNVSSLSFISHDLRKRIYGGPLVLGFPLVNSEQITILAFATLSFPVCHLLSLWCSSVSQRSLLPNLIIKPLSSAPSAPISFPEASDQSSSYSPMPSPGGRSKHVRQYPSQSTISPGPSLPQPRYSFDIHPTKLQNRLASLNRGKSCEASQFSCV